VPFTASVLYFHIAVYLVEPALGLGPGETAAIETFFKTLKAEITWRGM